MLVAVAYKTGNSVIWLHYNDAIMGTIASQITSLTIVYSTVYSDADKRKYQSSASLGFVRGIHRGTVNSPSPVNSPHKWPVTRKMFPFDDGIKHGTDHCITIPFTVQQWTISSFNSWNENKLWNYETSAWYILKVSYCCVGVFWARHLRLWVLLTGRDPAALCIINASVNFSRSSSFCSNKTL